MSKTLPEGLEILGYAGGEGFLTSVHLRNCALDVAQCLLARRKGKQRLWTGDGSTPCLLQLVGSLGSPIAQCEASRALLQRTAGCVPALGGLYTKLRPGFLPSLPHPHPYCCSAAPTPTLETEEGGETLGSAVFLAKRKKRKKKMCWGVNSLFTLDSSTRKQGEYRTGKRRAGSSDK